MGARAFSRGMKKIGVADPERNIDFIAHDVVRRLREIRHKTYGGAYLLADQEGAVYLLAEQVPTTDQALRRHQSLLVALYTIPIPEAEQVREDLVQHFCDIGFVSDQMIYEAVRMEEG